MLIASSILAHGGAEYRKANSGRRVQRQSVRFIPRQDSQIPCRLQTRLPFRNPRMTLRSASREFSLVAGFSPICG
jgi:hypothetical protein